MLAINTIQGSNPETRLWQLKKILLLSVLVLLVPLLFKLNANVLVCVCVCVVFVYSVKVSAESVSKLHSKSQRLPLILARVVRQMIPIYHTPCSYLYVAIAIWPVAAPLKLSRSSLSAVEALPPVTSLFAQQDAIHNVPFGQQLTQRERKLSLRVVKRK